jgi:hypothetical protein
MNPRRNRNWNLSHTDSKNIEFFVRLDSHGLLTMFIHVCINNHTYESCFYLCDYLCFYMFWSILFEKVIYMWNKIDYSILEKVEKSVWRYGISRDGIPWTSCGSGTVRYMNFIARYGTVRYNANRSSARYETVLNFCYTVSLCFLPKTIIF